MTEPTTEKFAPLARLKKQALIVATGGIYKCNKCGYTEERANLKTDRRLPRYYKSWCRATNQKATMILKGTFHSMPGHDAPPGFKEADCLEPEVRPPSKRGRPRKVQFTTPREEAGDV